MNRACAASLIVSSASGTAGAVLQPQLGQAGFHPLFGSLDAGRPVQERDIKPVSQSRLPGERNYCSGIRAMNPPISHASQPRISHARMPMWRTPWTSAQACERTMCRRSWTNLPTHRDGGPRGHQRERPEPESQAAILFAAIFFLRASQTVRTSDVISEQSSICRK